MGEVFEEGFGDEAESMKLFVIKYRHGGLFLDLNRLGITSLVLKVDFSN